MVVRRGKPIRGFGDDGSSSSDSDDAGFAAISKKTSGKKRPRSSSGVANNPSANRSNEKKDDNDGDNYVTASALPTTETSSNKRHHHANASRQAKMDALLEELQSTKPTDPSTSTPSEDVGSIYAHETSYYGDGYDRPPPQKMGSYVEPGQEHLTTNIFVGNLDACTTEEELTDAFRQFGEDRFCVADSWPGCISDLNTANNNCEIAFEIFSLSQVISILLKSCGRELARNVLETEILGSSVSCHGKMQKTRLTHTVMRMFLVMGDVLS